MLNLSSFFMYVVFIKFYSFSCVFPEAYNYFWEAKLNRSGEETGNYELRMRPKYDYEEGSSANSDKLCPKRLVERKKIFSAKLFSMVEDEHSAFLKDNGFTLEDDRYAGLLVHSTSTYQSIICSITCWHHDFDPESCGEVDEAPFPMKPNVEKISTASDFLSKYKAQRLTAQQLRQDNQVN